MVENATAATRHAPEPRRMEIAEGFFVSRQPRTSTP